MLLVTKAEGTLSKYASLPGYAHLGRLVQPRHYDNLKGTVANGRTWAADNDCFQGLNADRYSEMLAALPADGCRFVTVPDVVGDHLATLRLWEAWAPTVKALGLPAAFVLQDGCDRFSQVPSDVDAVFVGGTTAYKLSIPTLRLIQSAKDRALWVHMGRVSTVRRIVYAQSAGCDSFDSSKFSRWSDLEIPWALSLLASDSHQASLFHRQRRTPIASGQ